MSTSTRYPYWFTLYAACALLLVIPAGCSRESGTGANHTVTREIVDGVEIISNFGMPLYGEGGSLEKILDIGVEGLSEDDKASPYLFSDIAHAFSSEDKIYVLDRVDANIRIFDLEGNYITTMGNKGRGPGEFITPTRIYVDRNDFLYVFDGDSSSITVLDSSGNYLMKHDLIQLTGKLVAPYDFVSDNPSNIIVLAGFRHTSTERIADLWHEIFFSLDNNIGFFGPIRDYNEMEKTVEKLVTMGDSPDVYNTFLEFLGIKGHILLGESGQNLYYSRGAFPSEILRYSEGKLRKIVSRDAFSNDLIFTSTGKRGEISGEGIIVSREYREKGLRIVFNFIETGLGLSSDEGQLYNLYISRTEGDSSFIYIDIYDMETGTYLQRVPCELEVEGFLRRYSPIPMRLDNFIGRDKNNHFYFQRNSPYPRIEKYKLIRKYR